MLRKKIEFIEQMEHSECGLACVTMLLRYHGRNISLENIREEFGVPKGGNNLAHLQIIFRKYGIETKGLRINDVKKLKEVVTPFICFWENKHFIVIEKVKQNKILIVDPAKGRMWIDFEEFKKLFSQLILVPVKVEIVKEKNKRKSSLKILFDMVLEKKSSS
ncbi:cysteine peptidase family C39 domain-containing protein [Bacillus cereus]